MECTKQYQQRGQDVISTNFVSELEQIKKLAGINEFKGLTPYGGSNISVTGNEKGKLMKKHDIQPGTDAWFKLWFSRPYLTGEKPI